MTNIISTILISAVTSSGILTLVYYLLKETFKAHIKHQYDILTEEYKNTLIKKQKAVLVAELVAEWISLPSDYKRLNQLALEAFMWLPKDTAINLSRLLSLDKDAPPTRDVIENVREIILGKDEAIDPNLIIIFKKEKAANQN